MIIDIAGGAFCIDGYRIEVRKDDCAVCRRGRAGNSNGQQLQNLYFHLDPPLFYINGCSDGDDFPPHEFIEVCSAVSVKRSDTADSAHRSSQRRRSLRSMSDLGCIAGAYERIRSSPHGLRRTTNAPKPIPGASALAGAGARRLCLFLSGIAKLVLMGPMPVWVQD